MDRQSKEKELRLYAIVRADLLPIFAEETGKLVAQGGHAFLGAALDAQQRFPDVLNEYLQHSQAKITLKARNENELVALYETYKERCGAILITDEGRTVFDGPTVTMVGLGPICREDLPKRLQTLRKLPASEKVENR